MDGKVGEEIQARLTGCGKKGFLRAWTYAAVPQPA